MRYPAILLIPAFVIGISIYSSTQTETPVAEPSGEALYTQWCQDCHGIEGRDFTQRSWKLGSREEDIARVIREGHELLGMPAYGETLNAVEVESLTQFVLEKASEESFINPGTQVSGFKIRVEGPLDPDIKVIVEEAIAVANDALGQQFQEDKPKQREEMFNAFESELKKHNKPYVILKGNKETRLKEAIKLIDKLIINNPK